jgi:hypothetical protein
LLNAEKVSVLNFDVDLCTVTTTYECTIFQMCFNATQDVKIKDYFPSLVTAPNHPDSECFQVAEEILRQELQAG